VVDDPLIKEKLYEAAYQSVAEINDGLLNLGVLNKQEYDMTVESVTRFYRDRGETFMREEAIRNASLSAMRGYRKPVGEFVTNNSFSSVTASV
jgi:hypothetical protein